MKSWFQSILEHIELGPAQSFGGVTLFPLSVPELDKPGYLTLAQALAQGVLQVTEVSHGGSVPELAVVNRGSEPVLLLDGEELRGAKQNRVLNTTILVGPGTTVIIPVSCTEHGRWSYVSAAFGDSDEVLAHSIRNIKAQSVAESLKARHGYRSDQGAVWDGIAELHQKLHTTSPTGAMRDAFEARRTELQEYLDAFRPVAGMQGLLVFRDGKPAGLDLLLSAAAFAEMFPKLLRSYLIETLNHPKTTTETMPAAEGKAFLKQAAACHTAVFESPGLGQDVRLESDEVIGSALVVDGELIHFALFPKVVRKCQPDYYLAGLERRRRFRDDSRIE